MYTYLYILHMRVDMQTKKYHFSSSLLSQWSEHYFVTSQLLINYTKILIIETYHLVCLIIEFDSRDIITFSPSDFPWHICKFNC